MSQFEALKDSLPPAEVQSELVVAHPDTEWISQLGALFGGRSIETLHLKVPEVEQATLVLFRNGEVVTTSPVRALTDTIGRINTMIRAGRGESLDAIELPSILAELDEVPFGAHGADTSGLDLLFTTITRCIESRAMEIGDGRLRVGFQRLSRLRETEEDHTRDVYERFAETDVDVHVYGKPDWVPPESLATTVHGGYSEDFLRNWFVVYQSADGATEAALTAHDCRDDAWCGHWTFDSDRVGQIKRYLERHL